MIFYDVCENFINDKCMTIQMDGIHGMNGWVAWENLINDLRINYKLSQSCEGILNFLRMKMRIILYYYVKNDFE